LNLRPLRPERADLRVCWRWYLLGNASTCTFTRWHRWHRWSGGAPDGATAYSLRTNHSTVDIQGAPAAVTLCDKISGMKPREHTGTSAPFHDDHKLYSFLAESGKFGRRHRDQAPALLGVGVDGQLKLLGVELPAEISILLCDHFILRHQTSRASSVRAHRPVRALVLRGVVPGR